MSLAPDSGHGLLLVSASVSKAARWAARGLVMSAVVPLPGWTGLTLSQSRALSSAPYDVGIEVLSARPVPGSMRPAIGLFVLGARALVTVHLRTTRPAQRWYVWEQGRGLVHTPDLPQGGIEQLREAAGRMRDGSLAAVRTAMGRTDGLPLEWLTGVATALALPGEDILRSGPGPHARFVEPKPRAVAAFDALVAEHASGGADPLGGSQ